MLSRRDVVRAAGAVGAGAAAASLTGCGAVTRRLTQPELPDRLEIASAPDSDSVYRILTRAGYGPRPGDLERVRRMGVDAYLEGQVRPGRQQVVYGGALPVPADDTAAAEWRVRLLDTLGIQPTDLLDIPKAQVQKELQQAALLRAVYSRWQLREVMVEFWSDHFNVSQTKGDSAFYRTPYEAETVRRHALGRFRDLLGASARSPAMLYYLDNARNTRGVPNENYARELMELHTLGVDGGYTQKDVFEVARCFTGWTLKDHFWRGSFEYRPERHDDGEKRVLGRAIRGRRGPTGHREGEEILDLLAAHPSTARTIARKLCRRFVADEPETALVGRVAQAFQATGGQIAPTLRVLLGSPGFRTPSTATRKMKRPFDLVVSALRALNADTDGAGPLKHLGLMGQLPFHWAMPDGYPDRASAWAASLLGRWNFALALCTGRIPGTAVDLQAIARATGARGASEVVDVFSGLLFGRRLPGARRELLVELAGAAAPGERPAQVAAALIAAPEFQWR